MKYIYISLDEIFDTRFSLAAFYDPIGLGISIENKKYFNRFHDQLGNIPPNVFNELFKYRTKILLKESIHTLMVNHILDYLKYHSSDTDSKAIIKDKHKLYLNTYPYELTRNELYSLSKELSNIFYKTEIIVCRYPDEYLTADWFLKRKIDLIVMYNGMEWLNSKFNDMSIGHGRFKETELWCPGIYVNKMFFNQNKNINNSTLQDLVKHCRVLETSLGVSIIQLQFLPIHYFSLITEHSINMYHKVKKDITDEIIREEINVGKNIEKKIKEMLDAVKKNKNK